MERRWNLSLRLALLVAVLVPTSYLATRPQQRALAGPSCVSQAAVQPPSRYADTVARVRAIVCERLASHIPGLAVAVAVDGEIVWSEGFGYADLERKALATPATQFRIGSVSKPLTAAAVAQLYEQGRLDLDAPVQRYVPSFPEKGYPITTRLLAGHLAGIRHYKGNEFLLNKRYRTVLEGLTIFKDDPLLFPPGTRYFYSSYGWNLISAAVEGASGEEFLTYMDRRVFVPLGMPGTVPDKSDSLLPNRTTFYQRRASGGFTAAPTVDSSYKWASGGFLSTAEDLVRFGSAHLGPAFLKAESLELLFTPQRTSSGEATHYGLGWGIGRDAFGHRVVRHTGGSVGGTAILQVDRDSKVVLAIVSNLSEARLDGWRDVAELFDRSAP